jgi:hypothetical protein
MATGRIPTTANSPLTVKGDLFGYSTTQARVPVGNDGETLVADSSATTGLRYGANFAAGKNAIINGDFNVNQRGFSSTTFQIYTYDRFLALWQGNGTSTYSAQTFALGTAPVAGYEGKNFLQIAVSGESSTTGYTLFQQKIEGVRTLAGQTATISFWAKASSGTPKILAYLQQQFGTGGSPSAATTNAGTLTTITTSWARYSFTVTLPSITGKTLGTNPDNFLGLSILVSAGSATGSPFDAVGIQNNTFQFWGVQLEAGSVATAFQTSTGTIQGELAACQRYYYRQGGASAYQQFGTGVAGSSGGTVSNIVFPVSMRTAPTAVDYSNIGLQDGVNSIITVSSLTLTGAAQQGNNNGAISTAATGLTQYRFYYTIANNSTSAYLGFSAEL